MFANETAGKFFLFLPTPHESWYVVQEAPLAPDKRWDSHMEQVHMEQVHMEQVHMEEVRMEKFYLERRLPPLEAGNS